jgi:hypothetical protein
MESTTVEKTLQLLREAHAQQLDLSLVNVCTAMHRIARTAGRPGSSARSRQLAEDPEYARLSTTARLLLAERPAAADLRALSGLAWSLARLSVAADAPLLADTLALAARCDLSRAPATTLCSLAHAAAARRPQPPTAADRSHTEDDGERAEEGSAQRRALAAVAAEIARRGAAGISGRDLSGLLASFGRARFYSVPATTALAAEVLLRAPAGPLDAARPADPTTGPGGAGEGGEGLDAFSSQAIATSLWGLARLAGGGGGGGGDGEGDDGIGIGGGGNVEALGGGRAGAARRAAGEAARRAAAALAREAARRSLGGFQSQVLPSA